MGRIGRFQLEAAIQSVHAERAQSGRIEWAAIVRFYEQLIRIAPTVGTRTGYAAAIAEATDLNKVSRFWTALSLEAVTEYQPYWAVRAHLAAVAWETARSKVRLRPGDRTGSGPRG